MSIGLDENELSPASFKTTQWLFLEHPPRGVREGSGPRKPVNSQTPVMEKLLLVLVLVSSLLPQKKKPPTGGLKAVVPNL